jgi:hypothetical protein
VRFKLFTLDERLVWGDLGALAAADRTSGFRRLDLIDQHG